MSNIGDISTVSAITAPASKIGDTKPLSELVGEKQKTSIGLVESFKMGYAQKELPKVHTGGETAAHAIGEYMMPTIGAMATAPAAVPATLFGTPVSGVAVGAAGAAAGRAVQKATAKVLAPEYSSDESYLQAVTDVAGQAAGQALGAKVADRLTAATEAVAKHIPDAVKEIPNTVAKKFQATGAQMLKVLAGVKEQVGKQVLKDISILNTAPSMEVAKETFKQGMQSVGLKTGPEATYAVTGKLGLGQQQAFDFASDAFAKMQAGNLTPQEAIVAREQLSDVLSMPKFQNPDRAKLERVLIQMKDHFDDYLEPIFNAKGASYEAMRQDYHKAMVKKAFSSLLPQNQNAGASVLRGLGGASVAEYGREKGNPILGVAGIAVMSPYVLGKAIQGVDLIGKGVKALQEPAIKAAYSAMADKLNVSADTYAKGLVKEAQDHPELPKVYLPHLVNDEISKDPKFYD